MLHDLRKDYQSPHLEIDQLDADPFAQFHHWFQDAIRENVNEPNAMTLATCTPESLPSARIVLLKNYGKEGFTFFTNYESRKGKELLANPNAALVLFWRELHRQIRIEGKVEKISEKDSKAYFQSRPKGSQIGAWASPQSTEINHRDELLAKVEDTEKRFADQEKLPLPGFWGWVYIETDIYRILARPTKPIA